MFYLKITVFLWLPTLKIWCWLWNLSVHKTLTLLPFPLWRQKFVTKCCNRVFGFSVSVGLPRFSWDETILPPIGFSRRPFYHLKPVSQSINKLEENIEFKKIIEWLQVIFYLFSHYVENLRLWYLGNDKYLYLSVWIKACKKQVFIDIFPS